MNSPGETLATLLLLLELGIEKRPAGLSGRRGCGSLSGGRASLQGTRPASRAQRDHEMIGCSSDLHHPINDVADASSPSNFREAAMNRNLSGLATGALAITLA